MIDAESVAPSDTCQVNVIHATAVRRARERQLAAMTVDELFNLFDALADRTRLRLMTALMTGEMCVCDLAAVVGVSQSAVSHQLRLLRDLGLVRHRRVGRVVYYALDDAHVLTLLQQGLDHVAHGRTGHAAREARA